MAASGAEVAGTAPSRLERAPDHEPLDAGVGRRERQVARVRHVGKVNHNLPPIVATKEWRVVLQVYKSQSVAAHRKKISETTTKQRAEPKLRMREFARWMSTCARACDFWCRLCVGGVWALCGLCVGL